MALKQHTATVRKVEGLRLEAEARGFRVSIDEPLEVGGTNLAMNPVELMLCSLGACQALTVCMYGAFYGIAIDDIKVEIEGDRDDGTDPSARPGFQEIRCHYHIKSGAPEARIRQLLGVVEKRCPVGDSLEKGVKLGEPVLSLME